MFDPAFMNTAAISSRITYIDGDKGFLMHRGMLEWSLVALGCPLLQNPNEMGYGD